MGTEMMLSHISLYKYYPINLNMLPWSQNIFAFNCTNMHDIIKSYAEFEWLKKKILNSRNEIVQFPENDPYVVLRST